MKIALTLIAALAVAGLAAAQDGQTIKDRQGLCQISLPADWTPDKLIYVVTGGSQMWVASVDFADPAFQAQAVKIAGTVKTVK